MAKGNASSLVRGLDLGTSFLSALTKGAREREIPEEVLYEAVKPDSPLVPKFLDLIGGKPPSITGPFKLRRGGNRTTEQVIWACMLEHEPSWLDPDQFLFGQNPESDATVELLRFDHDVTCGEVLTTALRRGLERPLDIDALLFAEQYPEIHRAHSPIVFLCEPFDVVGEEFPQVVVLNMDEVDVVEGSDKPERRIDHGDYGGMWMPTNLFAFIRR